MSPLLIYTEQTTPRLVYTFNLLLTELLGLPYRLTHVPEEFANHPGPKFSYAPHRVADGLFFKCARLLFEDDIKYQPIAFTEHDNLMGFYAVEADGTPLPFDMFASAFFMVSRYEEYLPNRKDKYDRYRASQSMLLKAGILEKPMVNYYALALKSILGIRFPQLVFSKIPFVHTATFDIDMAYSYRGKGLKRTAGGLLRSLLFSQFTEARHRIMALMQRSSDPYDTYDFIFDTCERHGVPMHFFILLGDGSRFDKNISHKNAEFRELIKRIDGRCPTGIHLSYKSHMASELMLREKKRLEEITGHEADNNRFHYLRFQLPDTMQRLIKVGIYNDYSMGYGPHVGFRAGICTPFKFFNVKTNEATVLTMHPFAFMDTTFTHYYHSDNDFALDKIQQLMKTVRETGGNFTGLWHNSSFTEQAEWRGWREIFETVTRQASLIMKESEPVAVY